MLKKPGIKMRKNVSTKQRQEASPQEIRPGSVQSLILATVVKTPMSRIIMIVIVMGVSGSGKTTVGKAIASAMEWEFSDADRFHSDAAKEKMSRGEPLTDIDRAPGYRK